MEQKSFHFTRCFPRDWHIVCSRKTGPSCGRAPPNWGGGAYNIQRTLFLSCPGTLKLKAVWSLDPRTHRSSSLVVLSRQPLKCKLQHWLPWMWSLGQILESLACRRPVGGLLSLRHDRLFSYICHFLYCPVGPSLWRTQTHNTRAFSDWLLPLLSLPGLPMAYEFISFSHRIYSTGRGKVPLTPPPHPAQSPTKGCHCCPSLGNYK